MYVHVIRGERVIRPCFGYPPPSPPPVFPETGGEGEMLCRRSVVVCRAIFDLKYEIYIYFLKIY